jgi:heme/copper-type cytochrome/quinol oxidase subunit 2
MADSMDKTFDNAFGKLMSFFYLIGIGVVVVLIYHIVLRLVFLQKDKLDLTQGFRKQPPKIRIPAMIITLLITIVLVYILFKITQGLMPLYDKLMEEWLAPYLERFSGLDLGLPKYGTPNIGPTPGQ